MNAGQVEFAIIGCGSAGIASAYYLARNHGISRIALVDCGQPMAFTSAQSGENYRNWWPHPMMVNLANRSIDLLEQISLATNNRINMTRRGYALATRESDISEHLTQLHHGLADQPDKHIRVHENHSTSSYRKPDRPDWQSAMDGVDILRDRQLIGATFPSYSQDIRTVIHIRRGGDISGQQLGMFMLEYLKDCGARRVTGNVQEIRTGDAFTLELQTQSGTVQLGADSIINCAGPFASNIASMLGSALPVYNTFQQKIAFEDRHQVVPRNMPFSIDLDGQKLDWQQEERALLQEDPAFRWLTDDMPGSIHCRPDGGESGNWVKLGWAYNETPQAASRELPLDTHFPEVVLRGAARLNPALKRYYGHLPRSMHHYGGWYTMTKENWPLIGPMGIDGAYMNCGLSGFGTMLACATGELCAAWATDSELPSYAPAFSMQRYDNSTLMQELASCDTGIL